MSLSGIRLLEIGDHHHFKLTLPAQTTLLWTGYRAPARLERDDYADCTPHRFFRAMSDVRQGRYDLVVTYSRQQAPWHPRYWLRSFVRSPTEPIATLTRVFGVSMLRLVTFDTPLVAVDMHDSATIHSCNFFLLDKAQKFLKRELPVDRWQAVSGSAHPGLPTLRVRRDAQWQQRIAKLQPISLQAGPIDAGAPEDIFAAKSSDVFFRGCSGR